MNKFLLKFITIILSVSLAFSLVACDSTNEDDNVVTGTFEYQYVEDEDDADGGYYKITGYNVNSSDVENDFKDVEDKFRNLVIPETAEGLGVTGERKDLKVKEIGAAAFASKTILKSITIGTHVETIGLGAFANCHNLEEMTIPFVGESVDAVNKERIFAHLFTTTDDGSGLNKEITVKVYSQKDYSGNDLNSDEDLTYYVPYSLKKVTVLGGEIKTSAFYGCTNLEEIVVSSNVDYIGGHAFYNCTSLKKVTLPQSVKNIYQYAFSSCGALRTLPFDENSQIEYIGREAFSGCSSIGSNTVSAIVKVEKMPSALQFLGERAFMNCSSIRGFDLSLASFTEIPMSAFENCSSVEQLSIKSGTIVRTGAFLGCAKLKKSAISNYDELNVEIDAFDEEFYE